MKTNNLKLFLDDIRYPADAFIYDEQIKLINKTGILDCEWNIVRNYKDFCEFIDTFGVPKAVSFDHDLCMEHMRHYHDVTSKTGVIEYGNLKTKTGKHCAEYFVDKWREAGKPDVEVYIHSANRWGQIEIRNVLKELL
jgi:hypothetical protein